MLYVQGTGTAGNTGIVAAAFLEVTGGIFADGFESGGTSNWSSATR